MGGSSRKTAIGGYPGRTVRYMQIKRQTRKRAARLSGLVSAFGHFDFGVTARPRRVHGSDDTLHMQGAVLAIADCPARRARLCEASNSAGSGYFLSRVTSELTPAASAVFSNSPFSSVSHPLSAVVWTVCSLRNGRIGTGVPVKYYEREAA